MLAVLAGLTFVNALIERNRTSWALVFAAISPPSLFVASDYGQEGVFRVALFALPWMAIGATRFRLPRRVSAAFIAGLSVVILSPSTPSARRHSTESCDDSRWAEAIVAYEKSAPTEAVLMSMERRTSSRRSRRATSTSATCRVRRWALTPRPPRLNADADVAGLTLQLTKTVSATAYYAMVSDRRSVRRPLWVPELGELAGAGASDGYVVAVGAGVHRADGDLVSLEDAGLREHPTARWVGAVKVFRDIPGAAWARQILLVPCIALAVIAAGACTALSRASTPEFTVVSLSSNVSGSLVQATAVLKAGAVTFSTGSGSVCVTPMTPRSTTR